MPPTLVGKSMDEIRTLPRTSSSVSCVWSWLRWISRDQFPTATGFLTSVASNVGGELHRDQLTLINGHPSRISGQIRLYQALGKAAAKTINETQKAGNERNGPVPSVKPKPDGQGGSSGISAADARPRSVKPMPRPPPPTENLALVKIAQSMPGARRRRLKPCASHRGRKDRLRPILEEAYRPLNRRREEARTKQEMATAKPTPSSGRESLEAAPEGDHMAGSGKPNKTRRLARWKHDAICLMKRRLKPGSYLQRSPGRKQAICRFPEGRCCRAAGVRHDADAENADHADKLGELVQEPGRVTIREHQDRQGDRHREGGRQQLGREGNSTSGFISGVSTSLSPMGDLFSMAGMDYLLRI